MLSKQHHGEVLLDNACSPLRGASFAFFLFEMANAKRRAIGGKIFAFIFFGEFFGVGGDFGVKE
jgi:hypothetical protein